MNERTPPKRGSTRRPGGMQSQGSATPGRVAEVDQLLDVRERLVEVLDALDQDDNNRARFFAGGLLDDFDMARADRPA